jgi:O-antigen/teichoic acid export membrane protein
MIKEKYKQHKETIHNFIWRALQIGGKQGIIFLIFILCARLLTPYDFGIYNYVLAIMFLLILFGDFGISNATSKYVAEYNLTDKEKLKSVLFNSGIIILGLTILITILTLIIGPTYLGDKYVYILYLLPLIFLSPMTSLYDGIYRGLKKFKQLAIISSIIGFVSIFLVYFLIKQYGLVGALISQNLFYFILLLGLGFGYREFNFKINKKVMKDIGKYSLIIGLGTLGYYLYTRANLIFLGHFGFIEEVGYFELANKIFLILAIPFTILGQIIAPKITEYMSKKDYPTIKRKYIKYVLCTLVSGFFISGLLFLINPIIMNTFLKEYLTPNFSQIFNAMLFILPLTFLSSVLNQGFTLATGKAKYTLLTIPFGFFNIILTYLLMMKIGFMGAIFGVIISSTLNRIITFYLLYRNLKKLKD